MFSHFESAFKRDVPAEIEIQQGYRVNIDVINRMTPSEFILVTPQFIFVYSIGNQAFTSYHRKCKNQSNFRTQNIQFSQKNHVKNPSCAGNLPYSGNPFFREPQLEKAKLDLFQM